MTRKWYHWPLTEEQVEKQKTPSGLLLRIKIGAAFCVLSTIFAYFYTKDVIVYSGIFIGGSLAVIVFYIYYLKIKNKQ